MLVGVDGISIKVSGSAEVNGKTFIHDAIFGLDFLETHICTLNMAEGKLSINGHAVVLNSDQRPATAGCVKVTVASTVSVIQMSMPCVW